MKETGIQIAMLQETKVKDQTLEEDNEYKTYFASDPKDHIKTKGKGKKAYSVEQSGTAIIFDKNQKH